jgi:hypothetical protein
MWLRSLESRVKSLVGLSGSLFATRKEICYDFSGKLQSDFRLVLNSIKMGYRSVSDPLVIGFYKDVGESKGEWKRKIRTVLRGLTVFFLHIEFLNIFKYGFFSFQLFCHKLLRWLMPVFLFIVFITNIILAYYNIVFLILFMIQSFYYGLGIIGIMNKKTNINIIKIPEYFISVNLCILLAWILYLRGRRITMWVPTSR